LVLTKDMLQERVNQFRGRILELQKELEKIKIIENDIVRLEAVVAWTGELLSYLEQPEPKKEEAPVAETESQVQ
jgi:hypothetical protein